MPKTTWEKDSIQFPRLLGEMYGCIQFTKKQKLALCESMDLEWEDILSLLRRADAKFQGIKAKI